MANGFALHMSSGLLAPLPSWVRFAFTSSSHIIFRSSPRSRRVARVSGDIERRERQIRRRRPVALPGAAQ
jgi:hypothetical protein